MAFLKTLLILLLIYFGLKFIFKLAKPYLFRYFAKKAGQRFEEMFGNVDSSARPKKQKGDISIHKQPRQQRTTRKKVGEYVDFEEVE